MHNMQVISVHTFYCISATIQNSEVCTKSWQINLIFIHTNSSLHQKLPSIY